MVCTTFLIFVRFVCAGFGVILLLVISKCIIGCLQFFKLNQLTRLGESCFEVYIFQQFILLLFE